MTTPLPASPWRSRIVGSGDEDPSSLVANEQNWRLHPKLQREALASVLDRVGFVQAVIVNRRTGRIVDGHLRVSLAVARSEPSIPVSYVELDPDEEQLVLASLDPVGAMADTDRSALADLLEEISLDGALADLLDSMAGKTPDPYDEWVGMPEYHSEELGAWKSLKVNFAGPEDLAAFAVLVGQTLTDRTRSIWFPQADITRMMDKRYDTVDEA